MRQHSRGSGKKKRAEEMSGAGSANEKRVTAEERGLGCLSRSLKAAVEANMPEMPMTGGGGAGPRAVCLPCPRREKNRFAPASDASSKRAANAAKQQERTSVSRRDVARRDSARLRRLRDVIHPSVGSPVSFLSALQPGLPPARPSDRPRIRTEREITDC